MKRSDETLVQAFEALCEALHVQPEVTPVVPGSTMLVDSYPSVLYTRLTQESTDQVKAFCTGKHQALAEYLVREVGLMGVGNLPSATQIAGCTLGSHFDQPVWTSHSMVRTAAQSEESFEEQKSVREVCRQQARATTSGFTRSSLPFAAT